MCNDTKWPVEPDVCDSSSPQSQVSHYYLCTAATNNGKGNTRENETWIKPDEMTMMDHSME